MTTVKIHLTRQKIIILPLQKRVNLLKTNKNIPITINNISKKNTNIFQLMVKIMKTRN
jgi:hypothetical protein